MGRANIEAPNKTGPSRSLLSAASKRIWTPEVSGGVSFDKSVCDMAGTRVSICGEASDVITQTTLCQGQTEFDPFEVVVGVKLSSFDIPARSTQRLNVSEEWLGVLRKEAQDGLELCKAKQVEAEFWTGAKRLAAGLDPQGLVDVDAGNILNTQANSVSFTEALMMLNDAVASDSCAGQMFIHIPAGLLDALPDTISMNDDGTILTRSGHVIVPGAGYPGVKPTSVAADPVNASTVWIYATGSVIYYESAVEFYQETDSIVTSNDMVMFAERQFVTAFDSCVHYAVSVDPTR